MCFLRSQTTNENIKLNDSKLSEAQTELRTSKHNKPSKNKTDVSIGDLVMIKDKLNKNEARETYLVIDLIEVQSVPYAIIQKFDNKFMCRQYKIPTAKLIVLPNSRHYIPEMLNDKRIDVKLGHKVSKIDMNRHTGGRQSQIQGPTHSWNYEQYCDLIMDDITTYETQFEASYAVQDDVDSDNESSELNTSHSSHTVVQTDGDSSTDGPSTPHSSPVQPNVTPTAGTSQTCSAVVTAHNIYPNGPDEVDLSKVQHLEHALTSVPLEVSDAKVQRSQRPRRPINYAKYHSSGQKIGPGGDGGGG